MISPFLRRGESVSVHELRLMFGAFSRFRIAALGSSRAVPTLAGVKTLLSQNDTYGILTAIVSSRAGTQITADLNPTQDGNTGSSSFRQTVTEGFPATVVLKPGGRLWAQTVLAENFVVTEVAP